MATVPSYRTWVTGEVVVASYFNSNVRDAGNFWLSVPTCELRQGAAQSIPNNTITAVTFDVEDLDNDNMHSTVSNTSRVTAVTAGRYQLSGGVAFVANASGVRATFLFLNALSIPASGIEQPTVSGGLCEVTARTKTVLMNVTDFVELAAFQNSGAALNTSANAADASNFSVRWVGTT